MDPKHQEAYTFLQAHKLGVLSTQSSEGQLWGAAIYYYVDDRFNFYFLTHTDTQKYRNLREYPRVALTVADDYTQTTVQTAGGVTELPPGDERDDIFQKLTAIHPAGQYSWVTPVKKMSEGEVALMKLTPDVLQFSNFKPDRVQGQSNSEYVSRII